MQIPTAAGSGVAAPLPEGLFVLDVREDDEWSAGHVEGSTHVPLMQLGERYADLPALREAEQTLVVCRSGSLSADAVGSLLQQGLAVVNLPGRLRSWSAAGRALVADGDHDPVVI
jgi:rhodanese-related sulfurtransferase